MNDPVFKLTLKEKRLEKNLQQSELAQITGISPSSIARYEANKRIPSLFTAYVLAQALGCSLEDLIRMDNS